LPRESRISRARTSTMAVIQRLRVVWPLILREEK